MAKNTQNTARKMESVEPAFFLFEKIGDHIEGTLLAKEQFTYRTGDAGIRYTVITDEGERLAFNGTTQMNSLFEFIPVGTYVAVTYREDIKTNQPQPAKLFDVQREVDEDSN